MSSVTRQIILTADASKALETINQVDAKISALSSPLGSIGKLSSILKFTGVAAAVTATFKVITKNVMKFSGQIKTLDAQLKGLFKDKNEVLSATNELMAAYDWTKTQTQEYLVDMASKLTDIVSEDNLMNLSKQALIVAQRLAIKQGKALEEVMNDINRAARGHTQVLDKYGVHVEKNMQGVANILQSIADQTGGLEEVIKAQKETIAAQLENLHKASEEKWKQIAASFDTILAPALKEINNLFNLIDLSSLASLDVFLKQLAGPLAQAFASLKEPLGKFIEQLGELGQSLLALNSDAIKDLPNQTAFLKDILGVATDLTKTINDIYEALSPIVTTGRAITRLQLTLANFLTGVQTRLLGSLLKLNMSGIRTAFKTITELGKAIGNFALDIIKSVKTSSLDDFRSGSKAFISSLRDHVKAVLKDILDVLGSIKDDWKQVVVQLWNNLVSIWNDTMDSFGKYLEGTGGLEIEPPEIKTNKVQAKVQESVDQVFDNITAPVKKVEETVKVANSLDLSKMNMQLQSATTSVNSFTEALKKLDITKSIEEALLKMKANIETSLDNIGNLKLMAKAGEMMNAAAIAFQASVKEFNANPQQDELIKEAKQTNSYLERISRNLVGVDVFA